jgi:PD-(D/E)XK nuclease superfamily protein
MFYNPLNRLVTPEPDSPLAVSLLIHDEPFPGPNSSFIPGTDAQIAWDSTSMDAFKQCPRKYQLSILQGYTPKGPLAITLAFGIYAHRLLETWYKLLAAGVPKEQAYLSVVHLALYFGEQLPASSDNSRTKETLVRFAVWYLDQFSNDAARTITLPSGKAAAELSFQFTFMEIEGQPIYLCGHLDRLCEFQSGTYFSDLKTTGKTLNEQYFSRFSPNNQMEIYTIASNIILSKPSKGGIIDAVQLGVNFCRFTRHLIPFDPELIEESITDLQYHVKKAWDCARASYWPKDNTACSRWGGCEFQSICSLAPRQRAMYLKGNFRQRTWDPLRPR